MNKNNKSYNKIVIKIKLNQVNTYNKTVWNITCKYLKKKIKKKLKNINSKYSLIYLKNIKQLNAVFLKKT